jgi:NAD+ kinase
MMTIGILARPDLAEAGPALRELVAWLRDRGATVLLEDRTADLADGSVARTDVRSAREVAAAADALVVLGGDGTLLAASQAVESKVPILGVNFGSLGVLTEITLPELFPTLEGVLDGSARSEERRMLRASVHRDGREAASGDVLNDVVVTKGALSRILELDVTVDGLFVSGFRADGLIVSSPTGSTAYNLAAGGPILHPALPAMVLTPICPHMLTNRPLVVSDQARVEVRVSPGRQGDVHITFDGQHGLPLRGNDTVVVTRSQRTIRLVKAPARDYYEVLRTKLKWGESTARRQP